MQAPAIADAAAPAATLRYSLQENADEQLVALSPLPFTVGRAETADLQIDSSRVSREHATIHWENGQFWVRDLGSTNGTFLNGQRIEQEALVDGDVLRIADINLAFDEADSSDQCELVTQLRASQELLLRQGADVGYLPVWDPQHSQLVGAIATPWERHVVESSTATSAAWSGSRVSQDLQWLAMARAVELASALPCELTLWLRAADGGPAEKWLYWMAQQSAGRPLGVCLPASTSGHRQIATIAKDLGMKTAIKLALGQSVPTGFDQVWLSGEHTKGLAEDEARWPGLADLVQSAADIGAEVVASELDDEDSVRICGELGFAFVAGPALGGPRTASELVAE